MHFTVHLKSPVWTHLKVKVHTESYSLLAFKTMSSLWLASVMDVQVIVKWTMTYTCTSLRWSGAWKCLLYPRSYMMAKCKTGLNSKLSEIQSINGSLVNNLWTTLGSLHTVTGPFIFYLKALFLGLLKVSSYEGLTHFPLEDAYIGILARTVGTGTNLNVRPKMQRMFVLLSL